MESLSRWPVGRSSKYDFTLIQAHCHTVQRDLWWMRRRDGILKQVTHVGGETCAAYHQRQSHLVTQSHDQSPQRTQMIMVMITIAVRTEKEAYKRENWAATDDS